MENFVLKMIGDKKEYRDQMARVAALPEDYRFVYEKIQNYMWGFSAGSGMDMLKTQYDLISLFECGAADGRHVLEVTGEDVAAFCDELMSGNKLWTDGVKNRLNRRMKKKQNEISGERKKSNDTGRR